MGIPSPGAELSCPLEGESRLSSSNGTGKYPQKREEQRWFKVLQWHTTKYTPPPWYKHFRLGSARGRGGREAMLAIACQQNIIYYSVASVCIWTLRVIITHQQSIFHFLPHFDCSFLSLATFLVHQYCKNAFVSYSLKPSVQCHITVLWFCCALILFQKDQYECWLNNIFHLIAIRVKLLVQQTTNCGDHCTEYYILGW